MKVKETKRNRNRPISSLFIPFNSSRRFAISIYLQRKRIISRIFVSMRSMKDGEREGLIDSKVDLFYSRAGDKLAHPVTITITTILPLILKLKHNVQLRTGKLETRV